MNKRFTSAFYVIMAGCLWGCMGLLVRPISKVITDSIDIVFFRAVVSSFVLLAFLLVFNRNALLIKIQDIWCFIGTGVCSVTFFNWCYFNTIKIMDLSVAAVLLYTAPAFVIILSAFLFKERVGKRKVAALLLAFVGCALVSGIVNTSTDLNMMGVLFGIGAGFGYALYSIFSRCAINRGYSSVTITFYTFFLSAIATSFLSDVRGIPAAFKGHTNLLIYSVIVVLLVTLLAYILYTLGLLGMDNGRASVLASVEPVMATLVGIVIYGENPDIFVITGMCMVLGSIVIINRADKKK